MAEHQHDQCRICNDRGALDVDAAARWPAPFDAHDLDRRPHPLDRTDLETP